VLMPCVIWYAHVHTQQWAHMCTFRHLFPTRFVMLVQCLHNHMRWDVEPDLLPRHLEHPVTFWIVLVWVWTFQCQVRRLLSVLLVTPSVRTHTCWGGFAIHKEGMRSHFPPLPRTGGCEKLRSQLAASQRVLVVIIRDQGPGAADGELYCCAPGTQKQRSTYPC
jgi:hypothetical protein